MRIKCAGKSSNRRAELRCGSFTQSFLPTYMKKKGQNLATKEDI